MPMQHTWPRLCCNFEHLASELNTGVDGLSHLEMTNQVRNDILGEIYATDELNPADKDDFPLSMMLLKTEQDNDENLQEMLRKPTY